MAVGDIVQWPAELIAQLSAVATAGVKRIHLVFLQGPNRWAQNLSDDRLYIRSKLSSAKAG
jgi:hypothetical protein